MMGTSPKAYALLGTIGAIDNLFETMARAVERVFPNGTSLLIGIGILAGLRHPVRRKIYEHLLLLPGDHLRSVVRSLHLAAGTARYHLDVLQRDGIIYKEGSNGRTRYYVTSGEAGVNRLYARHWEYRDVRLRILAALGRMENAQPPMIAKALGTSRQLVSYHLARLEKAGQVRRHGAEYRLVGGRR